MTKDAQYYLDLLIAIEEELEMLYINLAETEIKGFNSFTPEYNYYLKQIIDCDIKENSTLIDAITHGYQEELFNLVTDLLKDKKESKILLINSNAPLFRLREMLECLSGDEVLDYAYTIKRDVNKILFQFLEELINNHYYDNIRKNLILYKYSLYFQNLDSENSLTEGEENPSKIELETQNLRQNLLYAKYIDKSLLTLECNYSLMNLENLDEDFEIDHKQFTNCISEYTKAVIDIINILARLTICPEDEMNNVYHDLLLILDDDAISPDLKDTINEMIEILGNIKNKFIWSRQINL